MQVLVSLSAEAEAEGLTRGQPLRDAQAICPALLTRPANPVAEAAFLSALRRWAGKFSPWVAEEPPAALIVDLTGCAHLFGGEEALLDQIAAECDDLGLAVHCGIADTLGAAWALARYAGQPVRRRAVGRRDRPGGLGHALARREAAELGEGRAQPRASSPRATALADRAAGPDAHGARGLPVAALRLPPETAADLTRLGLRRIADLSGQPRAGLARRFGRQLVQRLDQAMGVEPEPVSPAKVSPALRGPAHLPRSDRHRGRYRRGTRQAVPRAR
jgi:protein ImuB